MAKGDTLVIRLEAKLSTGYGWQVAKNDTMKLKVLGEPIVEPNKAEVEGGTEHQVFRFEALSSGSGTIELQYLRPWEKETPPLKTYLLTVKIQ